ncbi:MAG TPA: high frequency lysogenization protein HflD [Oleiagrimonas sp.]|nr:high frequency lysogenization protein HflD [Oleiagrimonas sp.]
MNEERVLALAGVFQGAALAHQLANDGRCDEAALASSIASVFRIDAPDVVGVFGTVADVRLGLRTLVAQLDDEQRDVNLMRMAATILKIERTFSGRKSLQNQLLEGIVAAQRQVDHFGQEHPMVITRLAGLYSEIISPLRPRVMVPGQPLHLQQEPVVERIRASLLAAVRAAVLWHQIGGRQWQLILRRNQWSMLARGLLTRATLDNG